MSVSIDIVPISDTLDVYGEPDPSSAYSLAGHVSVSVSSPYSMFERRRTARILLHSITLTFEGQTEVINEHIGYSAARLCSVTREIAPCEPVEMTNEGHEDSNIPCVWNVVFDLPIPGWLPPSSFYGREEVGVRYSLFAEAKFSHIGENQNNTWSFAALCSPFRSRVKTQDARKDVQLRRFICSSEDMLGTSTLQQTITYLVNASVSSTPDNDLPRFPAEILSKLQVLASVPEYVDVERNDVPLVLRMRTKDLAAEECRRIQVTSVSANVVQKERYRTRISSDYRRRFPIPPPAQQPPHIPLLDPHPISCVYEVGLGVNCGDDNTSRSFSLLPPGESGVHSLGENNFPFADDADAASPESATWYTLESCVPFVHQASDDKGEAWAAPAFLRPSVNSPLVNVSHEVCIELTCTYTVSGTAKVVSERLAFGIPVRFAYFAPDPQRRCITPPPEHTPQMSTEAGSPAPSLPAPMPYAPNLPPYSQLFDRNGDRKIDYSIPLPLYTPRSPNAFSSTLDLSLEGGDEMQPLLATPLVS